MQVTKTITLVNGGTTLVDEQDYEQYAGERWFQSPNGYAYRQGWRDGKHWSVYLHREINRTPAHLFTDHINGNKLDNRRCNLRTVNKAQNSVNTGKIGVANATSCFKGVSLHRLTGLWRARVKGGRCTYHRTDHDAAYAYNLEAIRLFGECAKLNVLPDGFIPSPPIAQKKHSEYRGVGRSKHGTWVAKIHAGNRETHLGTFRTEVEAALAYNAAAQQCYGERAKLNVV